MGAKSIAVLHWQWKVFFSSNFDLHMNMSVLPAILLLKNLSPELWICFQNERSLRFHPSALPLLFGPLFYLNGVNSMPLHMLFLLRMPLFPQANLCSFFYTHIRALEVLLTNESLPLKWLKCSIVFRMSPAWKEALHQKGDGLFQIALHWVSGEGCPGMWDFRC